MAPEGPIGRALERLRRRNRPPEAPERRPLSLGDLNEGRRGPVAERLRIRLNAAARSARGRRHAAGERVAIAWHGVEPVARQRIAAAIVLALVALFAFVLVPAAPCGLPGGDECRPPDDAIGLVPADALAYAHLDIDAESDQFEAAASLAARLPLLSALLTSMVGDAGGSPVDFGSQIRPWAGDEVAYAVLPGKPRLERVTMIEAEDVEGARDFAAGVLGPEVEIQDVGGLEVSVAPGGSAAALLQGFLLLGDLDGVTRMIDPGGVGGQLETAKGAVALEELPEERVAYAYVSGPGARTLLGGPSVSALDTFVDAEASTGVAAAFSVEGDVASLSVRSELDPALAADAPSFFAALPEFTPGLDADVGADALAYLGVGDPSSSVEALLGQAAQSAPALLAAFQRASETLRREGGISVADDLLPLLGSEAALSVEPVARAIPPGAPGVPPPAGVPYLSLLADGVDSQAAAVALAELQASLVAALKASGGGSSGRVPSFEPIRIAGIGAQSLAVSPAVQLTYATYDDRLVVATDPLGIERARAAGEGLTDSETFREVTEGLPGEVSLLAYLDLRDLISLGEQAGLATDPAYATLAPDLRSLEAAALAVTDDELSIRTELNVALGAAAPAQVEAEPLVAE